MDFDAIADRESLLAIVRQLRARVAELEAEGLKDLEVRRKHVFKAKKRCAELEAALRPFVDAGQEFLGAGWTYAQGHRDILVSYGMLREAARVLEKRDD
jgi:hypothetical protein